MNRNIERRQWEKGDQVKLHNNWSHKTIEHSVALVCIADKSCLLPWTTQATLHWICTFVQITHQSQRICTTEFDRVMIHCNCKESSRCPFRKCFLWKRHRDLIDKAATRRSLHYCDATQNKGYAECTFTMSSHVAVQCSDLHEWRGQWEKPGAASKNDTSCSQCFLSARDW